jgi:formamidopyrimidine-DNA glycosylase
MVYYGDSRHFGHFQWYPNGIEIDVGYDLLASSLVNQNETLDNALKLWRGWKRRFPDWQLCQALMSQKLFAGIGNYCKSECMYRARIRPDRLLKDLTENEDLVILNEAILILLEAYRAGGTTLFTFTGMEEESGPYVNQLQVYRRKTDNFGYTVKQVELKDKRTSHFVPELQK